MINLYSYSTPFHSDGCTFVFQARLWRLHGYGCSCATSSCWSVRCCRRKVRFISSSFLSSRWASQWKVLVFKRHYPFYFHAPNFSFSASSNFVGLKTCKSSAFLVFLFKEHSAWRDFAGALFRNMRFTLCISWYRDQNPDVNSKFDRKNQNSKVELLSWSKSFNPLPPFCTFLELFCSESLLPFASLESCPRFSGYVLELKAPSKVRKPSSWQLWASASL